MLAKANMEASARICRDPRGYADERVRARTNVFASSSKGVASLGGHIRTVAAILALAVPAGGCSQARGQEPIMIRPVLRIQSPHPAM